MFKEVKNNVANATRVIKNEHSSIRFAMFPGNYNAGNKTYNGVECEADGHVGKTVVGFTPAFLMNTNGKENLVGWLPEYNGWSGYGKIILLPIWKNGEIYRQAKTDNATREYIVIANVGNDNDIKVTVNNGAFRFECQGVVSNDIINKDGNAYINIPPIEYNSLLFGAKVQKKQGLKKLQIFGEI